MDRIASLLEQYPGPLNLPVSTGRSIYLLGTSTFMLVATAYYAIQPDSHGIAGWLSVLFCTLCIAAIVAGLVRGKFDGFSGGEGLVLDRNGFSMSEGGQRRQFKWAEVENFAVVGDELMLFRNRVGFNPANTGLDETNGFQWRTFHLPESYGLTNAGCVRLLSLWQERALRTD